MKMASFLLIAAGKFCLVSYWLMASFPGFSSHLANRNICPEDIVFVWTFPNGFSISFYQCPVSVQQPFTVLLQAAIGKYKAISIHFLKGTCLLLLTINIEGLQETFENPQRLLSSHRSIQQDYTWPVSIPCDSLLNARFDLVIC
jgi:hypothetical protein